MRANIEETAWKRFYRLAELKDCSLREAAGTVTCLWAQSQELVKTHGTREEIIEWASLFKISENEREMWITCLEKARFISLDENGLFRIHGNDIQLEAAASKTNRAAKGGKALQKKMRELKRLKAGLKQSTSNPQEAPRGSIQVNASQCNSMQFNAIQSEAELSEFSTDPIFTFLESLTRDNVELEPTLASSVAERIRTDIYPRQSKHGDPEALAILAKDITTIDGLKWFWHSARFYRDYCRKHKVKKIYGFKNFAEIWPQWIPNQIEVSA